MNKTLPHIVLSGLVLRRRLGVYALVTGTAIVVAGVPLFTSWMPLPVLTPPALRVYPGNHGFLHEIGIAHPFGWEAYYLEHHPGYLLKGLRHGGESLSAGTYRYDFYFALRPGHLTSLLSSANDVVRLEVADVSTGEILMSRTFQMADFHRTRKGLMSKSVLFSTWGRADHRFEPRVYWHGQTGIFLQRVELLSFGSTASTALQRKADDFETMMPEHFIERGFVVSRDEHDHPADTADAAIWSGLYAAAEAFRYRATQDPQARERMERSLWAIHSLVRASSTAGTMVRYIKPDGSVLMQSPSKDTYTGFFYALSQTLPYVLDPRLKKALLADLESLGNHLLDHDLAFTSASGIALDLNPYPGPGFLKEAIDDLRNKKSLRQDVIRTLRFARWYFWIHGQRPPPSFSRLMRELKNPTATQLEREMVPFLNDLRLALRTLQKNVHRSALRGAREGLNDTPYIKLDLLLLRGLGNLETGTQGRPMSSIEDLKILPSQSLHALHFLKVAGEMLPKPNRFDAYYQANLYEGKALLRTAIQWHQIDEEALTAVMGKTQADTRRTASGHLSYLALHDLIVLEKDPITRFKYQKLFEEQYQPMESDGNAMIDAMQASVGLSASHLGLAFWSLERYPIDRRGKGDLYWEQNRQALAKDFGGEVNLQAREPLPPDMRPRDAFLWQRSAHSLRGDQEGWLYPPLDFLFAYWLARTTPASSSTADSGRP